MAATTSLHASAARKPALSFQELNDIVSSALDKDLSFSPTLTSPVQSHSLSTPESKPLPVLPPNTPGFLRKLKTRASELALRSACIGDTATNPCSSTYGSRVRARASTTTPLVSSQPAPLVPYRRRSIPLSPSSLSSGHSFNSSSSHSELKRNFSNQFKFTHSCRSLSKKSSSISRRTISNPSPVPSSSLGCSPDSNPVRDSVRFSFEHPRRAPRLPFSPSEDMKDERERPFNFERLNPELKNVAFSGALLDQPKAPANASTPSQENKSEAASKPRKRDLPLSRPPSNSFQLDPFSVSSSPTAFEDEIDYIQTATSNPNPGTPTSLYIHHPYNYNPLLEAPLPSASVSQSLLPSPLSTMLFPLPPPSAPSLLEKRATTGGAIGGMARAVSSTLSFSGSVKEKRKRVPAPLKVNDTNSTQKRVSKLGALLTRLSPTSIVFRSHHDSSSFIQSPPPPSTPPAIITDQRRVAPTTYSPVTPDASCASLIFDEDIASPTFSSPLTPLDFGFGFGGEVSVAEGSPLRLSGRGATTHGAAVVSAHEVSVFEDDEEVDQRNVAIAGPADEEEDEDELMGMDPFGVIPRRSLDSVARHSAAFSAFQRPGFGRASGVVSDVSLDSRLRRRPSPVLPPPTLSLPNPPSRSQSPSPSPSAWSGDWTLGLPFFVDEPGNGFISTEKEERRGSLGEERMKGRTEEDDWTLGLNLTWSAGMLMGDERGDGHGRGGPTRLRLPPRRREDKTEVRSQSRRSGSPFPLLDSCGRERNLSHASAPGGLDIHRDDSEMERAFQALLTDAIEGRLSRFGRPKSLQNKDRASFCSSSSKSEHLGEDIALPKPPRTSGEWLSRQVKDTVDCTSVASTRTGPYYSARSSLRKSWQL